MRKATNFVRVLMAYAMLTGVQFFVSCSTDDNIDVSDLDSTIGIGTDNFKVPFGGTNDIRLDDVLELKEGDCIRTDASGNYEFYKEGNDIEAAKPKVKEVSFDTSTPKESQVLPIKLFSGMSTVGDDKKFFFGDVTSLDFTDPATLTILTDSNKVDPYKVKEIEFSGDGNNQIVKLEEATINGSMKLQLHVEALSGFVNYIDEIQLFFPKFLKLKNSSDYEYNTTLNPNFNVLKLKRVRCNQVRNITLNLESIDDIKATEPSAAEKAKGYMIFNSTTMKMSCVIKMMLILKKSDVVASQIPATGVAERSVDTDVDMGSGFTVTHAEGYFNPDITLDPSSINIGDDVPDFLNDDEVSIKLANPTIKLEVENNVDAEAIINGTLIATYNDGKKKQLDINGIKMKRSSVATKSTIVICRKAGTDAGTQYIVLNQPGETTKPGGITVVKDIAAILSKIPETIELKYDAKCNYDYSDPVANPPAKFDLYKEGTEGNPSARGCSYKIKPSYNFFAPLQMDPGSTIVYNDSIKDMNEDLNDNDIDFRGDTKLVITAKMLNESPLELELDPTPIGFNEPNPKKRAEGAPLVELKNDIAVDIKTNRTGNKIASNLTDKTPTELTITLSKKNANSDLKKLDGIAFKVKAVSAVSQTLNKETQKLKVTDMILTINGKVSLDLDSKID